MIIIQTIFTLFSSKSLFPSQLIIENIALRQQLAIMQRNNKCPRILMKDRVFWVILFRFWKNWRNTLVIVKPATVVKWHRKGFKLFWKFKSRKKGPGRPKISPEIFKLVLKMANANPLWGAPRIHGELLKLGIEISERTVSTLIQRKDPKPPSQTWKTFLKNHVGKVSVDFFTISTATFKVLYVFIILSNDRRKIVHFNITTNPTAVWTSQQIVQAFPWDTAPKYLMRDRDSIYGSYFKNRIKNMGISEVVSAPKSPWQNPFVERVIGSIRRECLDHVIVFNEKQLRRILTDYVNYYNNDRTHYNLNKDSPHKRKAQRKPDQNSKIIKLPRVGGLHHRYEWKKSA